MATLRVLDCFAISRIVIAILLSFTLLISPLLATPSAAFGTVVFTNRARLGGANASVGATVFSGDRLSTDEVGSIQIRAGRARLLLARSGAATLSGEETDPSATLTAGTATFSTANSKAFTLHVASATIRPNTDQPTIGKVTVLSAKELVVESVRGSLQIAVEDDVREIPERTAYRVVLDSNARPYPQGPQGAGSKGTGGPPIKAAKSKFIWYAVAMTGGGTWWVIHEVCESSEGWGLGC
ncbi:MAG TPA: hypothetical protein VNB49_07075 [Candidatus Dormibacteraeota bacterium]|nr:hypothetical protein [Candidatus Dormibacteraeota bacterium]